MFCLLCNPILVSVTAENPASQRQDVGNGSRLFRAFVATSGYSAWTLIQNAWRFEVLKHLRPLLFAISSSWSSSGMDKVNSPGLFTNMLWGHISSQFRGLLWLGSMLTLLKAETGDHAPAGRRKALAQPLSKSLLMLETCQTSQCSLVAPKFQFGLECSHFICWLEHSCHSPLKWQIDSLSRLSMSPK